MITDLRNVTRNLHLYTSLAESYMAIEMAGLVVGKEPHGGVEGKVEGAFSPTPNEGLFLRIEIYPSKICYIEYSLYHKNAGEETGKIKTLKTEVTEYKYIYIEWMENTINARRVRIVGDILLDFIMDHPVDVFLTGHKRSPPVMGIEVIFKELARCECESSVRAW